VSPSISVSTAGPWRGRLKHNRDIDQPVFLGADGASGGGTSSIASVGAAGAPAAVQPAQTRQRRPASQTAIGPAMLTPNTGIDALADEGYALKKRSRGARSERCFDAAASIARVLG